MPGRRALLWGYSLLIGASPSTACMGQPPLVKKQTAKNLPLILGPFKGRLVPLESFYIDGPTFLRWDVSGLKASEREVECFWGCLGCQMG